MKDNGVSFSLEYDEYQIENYRVQLTEFVNSGWATNGPWLHLVVTNRRFIFMPEKKQRQETLTVIPLCEVGKVFNVAMGRRDGVMFALKSGERLHMFVDWNQGQKLMRVARQMMSFKPGATPNYLM